MARTARECSPSLSTSQGPTERRPHTPNLTKTQPAASVRVPMQTFVASAIQQKSGPDKAANLENTARLVASAVADGARLVVLPELFSWRGRQSEEKANAESVPGPTSEFVSGLAARHGVYIVAGSLLRLDPDSGRCLNCSLLFGPQGDVVAEYDKIHLFDIDIKGKVTVAESSTRSPGTAPVCAQTELGNIGMAVCYDLRFPELFRALSELGAEIIVLPSAFTATTGEAHWEPLIRARAIENQCYVVAADQYGHSQHGFADYGHSMIVDPWGKCMAEAGGDDSEVLCARLDADYLAEVRRELPSLQHKRLVN